MDLNELFQAEESSHSRIIRSYFDLFQTDQVIEKLEKSLNKLSGPASASLMKELAKRNIRKDLIEKMIKENPTKKDSEMTLKDWGQYLIERFMNLELK